MIKTTANRSWRASRPIGIYNSSLHAAEYLTDTEVQSQRLYQGVEIKIIFRVVTEMRMKREIKAQDWEEIAHSSLPCWQSSLRSPH